jgi:hypothetical protein
MWDSFSEKGRTWGEKKPVTGLRVTGLIVLILCLAGEIYVPVSSSDVASSFISPVTT